MSFSQFSSVNKQILLGQMMQSQLTATSVLMMQIKMNSLLQNDEAEQGVNSLSEDLGKLDFLSRTVSKANLIVSDIDAEEDDG
jgi:hypothetical protein